MIIRINNCKGKQIAECELYRHDIGIWQEENKFGIKETNFDIEEKYDEDGFVDMIYDTINITLE